MEHFLKAMKLQADRMVEESYDRLDEPGDRYETGYAEGWARGTQNAVRMITNFFNETA